MKYLSTGLALLVFVSITDITSAHNVPTRTEALWDIGDFHGYHSDYHYEPQWSSCAIIPFCWFR